MTDPAPIACTLDASGYADRLAEMRALGAAALLDASRSPGGAELRFAARAGVRARLEAIVAAEASCCAFLGLRVDERDGAIFLSIEGPDSAAPVLDDLVGAFSGEAVSGA